MSSIHLLSCTPLLDVVTLIEEYVKRHHQADYVSDPNGPVVLDVKYEKNVHGSMELIVHQGMPSKTNTGVNGLHIAPGLEAIMFMSREPVMCPFEDIKLCDPSVPVEYETESNTGSGYWYRFKRGYPIRSICEKTTSAPFSIPIELDRWGDTPPITTVRIYHGKEQVLDRNEYFECSFVYHGQRYSIYVVRGEGSPIVFFQIGLKSLATLPHFSKLTATPVTTDPSVTDWRANANMYTAIDYSCLWRDGVQVIQHSN